MRQIHFISGRYVVKNTKSKKEMKTVGYIKLYRALNEWEWKSEPNMVALFVHLLMNANYETTRWRGLLLEPGQLIVGRKTTPKDCGISENQYRKCIERLEKTNEITIKSTNKYSVVSLVNWAIYQSNEDKSTNKTPTKHQQSTNKAPQIKERKKERKKELSSLSKEEIDFGVFGEDEKFLDLWKSYLGIRKEFRRSNNKTTLKSILKNLEEWEDENIGNATTSLENAIKGGYYTLKKPKSAPTLPQEVKTIRTNVTDIATIRKMYAQNDYINKIK